MNHVELAAFDNEREGVVYLARWPSTSEQKAIQMVRLVDDAVTPDMEPGRDDRIAFLLDIRDDKNGDLIGSGERRLPLQIAMHLAPKQVQAWLNERPWPDDVMHLMPPMLDVYRHALGM